MKNDPRYCSVCEKLLLKQDLFGYVLLTTCDSCDKIIHEQCYMKHHREMHDLIAVIVDEQETIKQQYFYF
ncbi:MAG: hypothetical protein ACTSQ9_05170 [Candidatus Hodarchaeales archaeon]|jgi:phage FluMu protein Com